MNLRCASSLCLTLTLPVWAQTYRAVDLGTLGGPAVGWSIHAGSPALGSSAIDPLHNDFHAMAFDPAGAGTTDLGVLAGYTQSVAFTSDATSLYGVSYSWQNLIPQAVRWTGGSPTALGAFVPHAANDSGTVVGYQLVASGSLTLEHACAYAAGTLTDLGTLGGMFSHAQGVNAAGWIVGSAQTSAGKTHACVWINGVAHDLGTLGGGTSQAAAINDLRQVVGWSQTVGGSPRACRWTLSSAGAVLNSTDLGALGAAGTYAQAINNAGVIVGVSDGHAFVFRNGAMTDLNASLFGSPGWRLDVASAIDEFGRIVGTGTLDGRPAGFLLVCPPDFNNDGFVDIYDLTDFVSCFEGSQCGPGRSADFNADGFADIYDFTDFVTAFETGC